MIEINLLPEELRAKLKVKAAAAPAGAVAGFKKAVYIVPVFFGVLLCLHAYLLARNISCARQLRALNNKWLSTEPQRKALDEFNKDYVVASQDASAIAGLLKERLLWATKLEAISRALPAGVWLVELSLAADNFSLQGSAFSSQKNEMTLISDFLEKLKGDEAFFNDFAGLELGSVQRRALGAYDIADFVLSGKLKKR